MSHHALPPRINRKCSNIQSSQDLDAGIWRHLEASEAVATVHHSAGVFAYLLRSKPHLSVPVSIFIHFYATTIASETEWATKNRSLVLTALETAETKTEVVADS